MIDGVKISAIVEGHGEVSAVPILVRRVVDHIAPEQLVTVLKPIRVTRSSFVQNAEERKRAIELAALKAGNPSGAFILILLDADDDCPALLAPQLLAECQQMRSDFRISLILAKKEYEGWFLAAAESLRGVRSLPNTLQRPNCPEEIRDAKGWIKRNRTDCTYSETIDQAAYSAYLDIDEARSHSTSFDKFYRDLAAQLSACSSNPEAARQEE